MIKSSSLKKGLISLPLQIIILKEKRPERTGSISGDQQSVFGLFDSQSILDPQFVHWSFGNRRWIPVHDSAAKLCEFENGINLFSNDPTGR
jgi:hypothetical protein